MRRSNRKREHGNRSLIFDVLKSPPSQPKESAITKAIESDPESATAGAPPSEAYRNSAVSERLPFQHRDPVHSKNWEDIEIFDLKEPKGKLPMDYLQAENKIYKCICGHESSQSGQHVACPNCKTVMSENPTDP
jgi:hypothetical protein